MIHVSHADVPIYCEDADEDAAIEAAAQAAKKDPAKPPTAERPKGRKRDAEEAAEGPRWQQGGEVSYNTLQRRAWYM